MKRTSCLLALSLATLAAMSLNAHAGVIVITNLTPGNFDASSGNRTFTVTGLEPGFGNGTILSATISINFAKADGEAFDPPFPGGTPFYNEIHFHLTSPGAEVVHLIEPNSWGSGSGQFDGTILFDQTAAQVVNFGAAPVAGTFRPTGPGGLTDYAGDSALGVWNLFIQDTVGADSLRFRQATLTIITQDAAAVPEPSTFAVFGVMLALFTGCWLYRRNRVAAPVV